MQPTPSREAADFALPTRFGEALISEFGRWIGAADVGVRHK